MNETKITENAKSVTTLKSARRQYISNSVAMQWLLNAEKVITRGGRPMKLSTIARVQINERLSELEDRFILPSSAGITRMENNCIRFALYLLRNGRFPTVAKFFSQPKEDK